MADIVAQPTRRPALAPPDTRARTAKVEYRTRGRRPRHHAMPRRAATVAHVASIRPTPTTTHATVCLDLPALIAKCVSWFT